MATRNADAFLPLKSNWLHILLCLVEGEQHGYGISVRIRQLSQEVLQVTQGSLYPALHRLENRGLLAADWKDTERGRPGKFYRLTRKGRAQLDAESASWQRLSDAVGLILRLSEEGVK